MPPGWLGGREGAPGGLPTFWQEGRNDDSLRFQARPAPLGHMQFPIPRPGPVDSRHKGGSPRRDQQDGIARGIVVQLGRDQGKGFNEPA